MKRYVFLMVMLVFFSISACSLGEVESTTKFENKESVFYPCDVKDFTGTVTGYEETEQGTIILVYEEKTGDTHRVLIMEESKFINGAQELYDAREIGWKVSPVCDYNRIYYTDFYPGTRLYLVTE